MLAATKSSSPAVRAVLKFMSRWVRRGRALQNLFELLDRSMPPHQAGLAVDHQGRSEQHVHGDDPADFGDVLDRDRDAQPPQGRFHVGFQLPAFRAAGA